MQVQEILLLQAIADCIVRATMETVAVTVEVLTIKKHLLYFSPQMYFNPHRRKCTAFLRKISILSPHKIHLSQ